MKMVDMITPNEFQRRANKKMGIAVIILLVLLTLVIIL